MLLVNIMENFICIGDILVLLVKLSLSAKVKDAVKL